MFSSHSSDKAWQTDNPTPSRRGTQTLSLGRPKKPEDSDSGPPWDERHWGCGDSFKPNRPWPFYRSLPHPNMQDEARPAPTPAAFRSNPMSVSASALKVRITAIVGSRSPCGDPTHRQPPDVQFSLFWRRPVGLGGSRMQVSGQDPLMYDSPRCGISSPKYTQSFGYILQRCSLFKDFCQFL